MEIECPHCAARYRVPADAVPTGGRDIHCARCGRSWFQDGDSAADTEAARASADAPPLGAGLADVGAADMAPFPVGPAAERAPAPAWEEEARGGGLGVVGWLLLFAIVALAVAGYAVYAGWLVLP